MSKGDFQLLMIGAMYENGGNLTHRFLDGHPQLYVYPFESQLGTRYVSDALSSTFPLKYRWPVFALHATPEQDYAAIIDEELRVRTRTPYVSKFRDAPFLFDDAERRAAYLDYVQASGRSAANNVAAFFRATFDAWRDRRRSGRETVYVGYSPIVTVDAERILTELPHAHVLHVVRNPWSAYADTCKRPVPLSLDHYTLGWAVTAHYALACLEKFPERMHLLRVEDVMRDPQQTLAPLCAKLGIDPASESLTKPSWNGSLLAEIRPWGTIRFPTPQANLETARELAPTQVEEIRARTKPYLDIFDYRNFL